MSRHKESNCLLCGTSDNHMEVNGNSLSGWLVFTVPKVKEGIILVRMKWWCQRNNEHTKDWTEVNGGMTTDTTPEVDEAGDGDTDDNRERHLGNAVYENIVPNDLEMDYAINGVKKTMNYDEWKRHTVEYVKNVAVWLLLNDDSRAFRDWEEGEEGEDIEVAIWYQSQEKPHQSFCVSYVYFA
mmetsp:Transcript_60283/g.71689  ORF Transcript_60283/g.71689 Transcript_60283/m.71689 type:complete len:183 (-) Transcript_60283:41-589(-)